MATNLGLTLIQVPILLHYWTHELYGLWLALFSTVALITSLDAGHQDYVGNLLNRYYVENQSQLRSCLGSALLISLLLGGVELIIACALVSSGGLDSLLGMNHDKLLMRQIHLAALLYIIYWVAFGSMGGVIVRLYNPLGLYARAVALSIAMRVIQFGAVIAAAACSQSILIAMGAYCLSGSVVNFCILIDVRHQLRHFWPWWSGCSIRIGWNNLRRSLVLTFSGILEQTSSNGVVLLVARSLGADVVPQFTTLRTVANIITQGSTLLLTPLAPDFGRYHVKREADKIVAVLSTAWTIGGILAGAGVIIVAAFAPHLYSIWTHGSLVFEPCLFYFLLLTVAVRCSASGSSLYLASINQLHAQLATAAARGLSTIAVILMLIPPLGVAGAGAGLLIAEILASLIVQPMFSAREISRLHGLFPWRVFRLTLVSLLLVGSSFLLAAHQGRFSILLLTGGLAGIVSIAALQWHRLPTDVHGRLISLVSASRL